MSNYSRRKAPGPTEPPAKKFSGGPRTPRVQPTRTRASIFFFFFFFFYPRASPRPRGPTPPTGPRPLGPAHGQKVNLTPPPPPLTNLETRHNHPDHPSTWSKPTRPATQAVKRTPRPSPSPRPTERPNREQGRPRRQTNRQTRPPPPPPGRRRHRYNTHATTANAHPKSRHRTAPPTL